MSLSEGCWWMALAHLWQQRAWLGQGLSGSPDGKLPPRPCQHLLPRRSVRALPAGTEMGTPCHPIAMAANEPRARLIKETSLMQGRGEVGWKAIKKKETAYAGPQSKQQK